jgi:uncharacterized protein YdgA (DUF945 family)
MKKLLLAVPVIAGVAGASWAGSTFYSGNESRAAYERVIADLNDTLGLAMVTTEYVPGFLSSEATTAVLLTDGMGSDALFHLHHVIEHSPLGTGENAGLSAARITTTVITEDIGNELVAEVLQGFGDQKPVVLQSRVGFDGTVDNEFTIAPFEFAYKRGSQVRSQAAVWNIAVDSEGSYVGSGQWGGAVIETPTAIVNVSEMNDSFDYTRHSSGLYNGNYEQTYSEVRVTAPQMGLSAGIRDIAVSLLSDISDDKLSGNFAVAINDIDAPIALDSAQLKARFGGLGVDGFKQLNTVESEMLAADFDADPAAGEQYVRDYLIALGAWIEAGSYIGYDLSLGNAGGTADASITATFDGDGSPSGHDLLTSANATYADLVRAMKFEASLTAPDEALALTPAAMFLDPAMLAPWIVADGRGLTSNILVDDMIANINGDPMPLEMMLGDELYAPLKLDEFMSALLSS